MGQNIHEAMFGRTNSTDHIVTVMAAKAPQMDPKSWQDRLIGVAIAIAICAFAIDWSFHLLRPLLPFFIVAGVLVLVLKAYREWQNRW